MERGGFNSEEALIQLGKDTHNEYLFQCSNSDVPASFHELSSSVSLDLFPELSPLEVSEVLLGGGFENNYQAWLALKYAEAMSILRKIYFEDNDFFMDQQTTEKYMRDANLAIGTIMVNETDEDEAFMAKIMVEEYFENPLNKMKVDYLAQAIKQVH